MGNSGNIISEKGITKIVSIMPKKYAVKPFKFNNIRCYYIPQVYESIRILKIYILVFTDSINIGIFTASIIKAVSFLF